MQNLPRLLGIYNAKIITPFRLLHYGTIIIKEDLLSYIGDSQKQIQPHKNVKVIDAQGLYAAPGFIDLHVHGGGGGDVMDADPAAIERITMTHAKGGTTSLLLTTLTAPLSRIEASLEAAEKVCAAPPKGARVIGVHLEGPYINPDYAGAQNSQFIHEPCKEEYLPILRKYRCIKRVTFAPELPGALELAQELKNRGILASIGHSGASYREILAAIEAGCTHVTHLFSAMSGIKRVQGYRIPGVIESTLLLDELTTELIADGHHLPPSLLKLAVKAKGVNKLTLVTDAMAAAGLSPGRYTLGELKVIVEHNVPELFEQLPPANSYVAKLENGSSFAGSVATMNFLVHNMVQSAGLSLQEAIKMATVNPARILGINNIVGVLHPGMKADIVLFDKDLEIMMTVINGQIIYVNPEFEEGER